MIEHIAEAFPNVECKWLTTEDRPAFFVADFESEKAQPAKIVEGEVGVEETERYLLVTNETAEPVHFIAVDKCLIPSGGNERCDCVLINQAKLMFVELKLNVESDKPRAIKSNIKKATDQLGATIDVFTERLGLIGHSLNEWDVAVQIAPPKRLAPSYSSSNAKALEQFVSTYAYLPIVSTEVRFA